LPKINKEKKKTQMNKIGNKNWYENINTKDYKQLLWMLTNYANKLDNYVEMNKFLEIYNFPRQNNE
jgi:hypothetical protein